MYKQGDSLDLGVVKEYKLHYRLVWMDTRWNHPRLVDEGSEYLYYIFGVMDKETEVISFVMGYFKDCNKETGEYTILRESFGEKPKEFVFKPDCWARLNRYPNYKFKPGKRPKPPTPKNKQYYASRR